MDRQNIVFGNAYEKAIGFSRAVRHGNHIAVSGTAPISDDGTPAHPGDLYRQTHRCLEIILSAITKAGGSADGVVRTRIFLKNIDDWEQAAKAHGEVFANIQPACTFVEVSRFIHPDWLVEIEADATLS